MITKIEVGLGHRLYTIRVGGRTRQILVYMPSRSPWNPHYHTEIDVGDGAWKEDDLRGALSMVRGHYTQHVHAGPFYGVQPVNSRNWRVFKKVLRREDYSERYFHDHFDRRC